jgi:hypothetical protein
MATPVAKKRLMKEFKAFAAAPPPFIWAKPNESKCALSFLHCSSSFPLSFSALGEEKRLILRGEQYPRVALHLSRTAGDAV